jgi:hypothetical protein
MKSALLTAVVAFTTFLGSCQKSNKIDDEAFGNGPKTEVPADLPGTWMYGNFSMTEYWSTNPSTYIGNAFEFAIAFKFNANGTYEHYFTSRTVSNGISTYHQSVTKGTIEIDKVNKRIITHAGSARYKRTQGGITQEDRNLSPNEITTTTTYEYTMGTEPNGVRAVYLKLNGTGSPLTFLQKF